MAAKKNAPSRNNAVVWRYAISVSLITLTAMGVMFGMQQAEQFLIRDPRFLLAPPSEYGEESPNLHIQGVRYASRAQVLRVFQPDIGRSLYMLPLAERRKALMRIAWVKDAAIQRNWPNQVAVQVKERQPAAFVQLRSESISRWALIDADGIILEPPEKAPFQLPVITGIRTEEAAAVRGMRVRRMTRMLDDLGPLREKVSEIDVADLDDLKVSLKVGDRAVVVMLGDHNFQSRLQHFLEHYEEIQKRIPNATTLDLRLDDRITVLGGRHE